MASPDMLPFLKMNGLGNDFVVLDGRKTKLALTHAQVKAIADRKTGIGCDQLIVMEPSPLGVDVFMRIYNAEGGEVEACGNATRCIGHLVMAEQEKDAVTIETVAGLLIARRVPQDWVSVDMGEPRLQWDEIPLAEPFHDTRAIELQIGPIDNPVLHSPAVVNMGNPHAIFFVDDLAAHDLGTFGPLLENHPIFPERANITIAEVKAPDHIVVKVWERGAGLTDACGTAACATTVAAIRKKLTGRDVTITLPGGDLRIAWRESDNHVIMSGPYQVDFDGVIGPELLGEGLAG